MLVDDVEGERDDVEDAGAAAGLALDSGHLAPDLVGRADGERAGVLDRSAKLPLIMLSAAGGVDIEEVARTSPEKIVRRHVPREGLRPYQARALFQPLLGDGALVQQAANVQVFDQRGVSAIDDRELFTHADKVVGVSVPAGRLADGDEANAVFHQAARQETALAKAIHSIAIANGGGFTRQIERGAGLLAGHQPEGRMKVVVQQACVLAGLEVLHGLIDDVPHLSAAIQYNWLTLTIT